MSDEHHEPAASRPQPTHAHAAAPSDPGFHPRVIAWPLFIVLIAAAGILGFRATSGDSTVSVTFITADQTEYWDTVLEGARAAAVEHNVSLSVEQPSGTLLDQNEVLIRVAQSPPDAVAISPVDALRQAATLRELAAGSSLVTVDSDSLLSERVCFVGADNYFSGKMCAEMVTEALPEGGRVLVVCGPLDKANGRERREGLIDALLGRKYDSDRELDPIDAALSGNGFEVPKTLEDELDPQAARDAVAAELAADPSIDAVVGLYGYHAGSIAEAVESLDAEARPVIIGFDALPSTLALVEAGDVFGVVAQDQWTYGYEAVRVLAAHERDREYGLPLNREINFPPLAVTADTLGYYKFRTTRQSAQ